MKQQTKKLLRVLLTLVMLIGLLPTAALAASEIDKVELTCTRAQIVTFLWRSQRSPAADSGIPSPTWRLTPTTTARSCGLWRTALPPVPLPPPSAPTLIAPAPRS